MAARLRVGNQKRGNGRMSEIKATVPAAILMRINNPPICPPPLPVYLQVLEIREVDRCLLSLFDRVAMERSKSTVISGRFLRDELQKRGVGSAQAA